MHHGNSTRITDDAESKPREKLFHKKTQPRRETGLGVISDHRSEQGSGNTAPSSDKRSFPTANGGYAGKRSIYNPGVH